MKKKCIPSRDILINKYPYPIRPIIDFNCHHIKKGAKARLGVNELRQHRQSEEALPGQMQIPAGRQVQEILGRSWVYLCSFGILWDVPHYVSLSTCRISLYVHPKQKVVWNAEIHGYYAKTIGWQVGQQPPKIKQTKMNQVVFYTSFDLLGMHKYLCSCSQQQAALFLNWVLPILWEFKGKSNSGFLLQPISLPIFHRLFWALGAPSMIPPVAVKMSHFGWCWRLRNWNTNSITDMKTSVSCGHNQWPHATPPNRAWCSWGETGAAQRTPTTTQHQTIKPSSADRPSAKKNRQPVSSNPQTQHLTSSPRSSGISSIMSGYSTSIMFCCIGTSLLRSERAFRPLESLIP